MDQAIVSIIAGAMTGGLGTELLRRLFSGKEHHQDEITQIRHELRTEVADLHTSVDKLETDLVSWKDKYYDLLGEYTALQAKYMLVRQELDDLKDLVNKSNTSNSPPTTPAAPITPILPSGDFP